MTAAAVSLETTILALCLTKTYNVKQEQATALIAQVLLKEGADSQPKALAGLLTIPVIQVHNVMNKLNKDGIIEIGEDEKGKTYTVKNPEGLKALAEAKPETPAETKPEKKVEAPKKEQVAQEPTGRHNGKFLYGKVAYSKSACVLKVVSDYVEQAKPTLKQLRATWPDSIVSRFGVINEKKPAQDLSKDRNRYHMKAELTTSDGKAVVVTNQWSQDRFLKFCEAAEKVGLKIKPE